MRPSILKSFLLSVAVVVCLGFVAINLGPNVDVQSDAESVRVYCASGVARPVQEAIELFNQQFEGNVELVRTGGSGELMGQIIMEHESAMTGGADVFVSADEELLLAATHQGIVTSQRPIAFEKPVIAVRVESTLEITSLTQMISRKDLRFGIASRRAAVGRLVRDIAVRDAIELELESRKTVDSENVMTLAQALVTGSLDAAVIWDATVVQINHANQHPVLKITAPADATDVARGEISVGVISRSISPAKAGEFAQFLSESEAVRTFFRESGFELIRLELIKDRVGGSE